MQSVGSSGTRKYCISAASADSSGVNTLMVVGDGDPPQCGGGKEGEDSDENRNLRDPSFTALQSHANGWLIVFIMKFRDAITPCAGSRRSRQLGHNLLYFLRQTPAPEVTRKPLALSAQA
jgi:hypothetical protein